MPNSRCPVTWPVEASDDLLIPAYARPDHVCKLDADHVDEPHLCLCGVQLQEAGR